MSNIKSKHCDFTFSLSDLTQCDDIISVLPDFDTWAYIRHVPDVDNGSDHVHFYIHVKQPISIDTLANKLDLPSNMIEWVRMKTRMIQYLIHKNQPDKHQYKDEDIFTNNREFINKFLNPVDIKTDIFQEYKDLSALSDMRITPHDFLVSHSDSISSLPFYSRQIYLMRLLSLYKEGTSSKIK